MPDRFASFEELKKVYAEGTDFSIGSRPIEGSQFLVMAPHGGKIEPFTSELAVHVAGGDYSLYTFEGNLPANNRDLHVTSHAFFEPRLDALLESHRLAVAFHGRRDEGDPETIFMGGLDKGLVSQLSDALNDAGFSVATVDHKFPGANSKNTCNRCTSGMGVQFEIPASLRQVLSLDNTRLEPLFASVRGVMRQIS